MAWKLSGEKLPIMNGWQKNALMLRTIVLSIPKLNVLDEATIDRLENMRAFNRGTITADQLRERLAAPSGPPPSREGWLHEPLEFHGWTVDATLVDWRGSVWWLTNVTRSVRTVTEGDKKWLHRVLGVLGCDPVKDKISVGQSLEEIVAENIPVIYAWPNTFERQEIQFSNDGKRMQVVPKGSRVPEGFSRISDD